MRSRIRIICAAIFLCAMVLGGFLLHKSAEATDTAPAFTVNATAVKHTATTAAQQAPTTETEQQSMLPALLIAASALTVTVAHILYRRRAKDRGT